MSAGFRNRNAQRGLAMLALVAILVMGSLYWLMSGLAQPANRTAAKRAQNAKVLQNAKAALIGYVAMNAAAPGATITDDNPGSLPCPEAPGDVGTVNEGRTAPSCSGLPAVGRLPWRTLGIEKPLDAASEPLWYIVSPGWAKPNPGGNTIINSNTVGQLTVDGIEAVAVIIAPGERLNIPGSANCVARNQARNVPSPAIDYRDYLDCQNATLADLTFASSDPVGPFNDQVLAVTTVEILPVIEAAVAQRFERVFAPQIVGAYSNIDGTNSTWPTTGSVLPFAVPLTDPTTSNLKGTRTSSGGPGTPTGTFQGLLPLNRVRTRCTPLAPATECTPAACTAGQGCDSSTAFIRWSGTATMSGAPGDFYSPSCTVNPAQIDCTFHVRIPLLGLGPPPSSVNFTLTANADNVGMGFRQLQTNVPMSGVLSAGRSAQGALTATGGATITLTGQADTSDTSCSGLLGCVLNTVCGLPLIGALLNCAQDSISIPISMIVDHSLVDPNDNTYNWFVRNKWHEVTYYVVAPQVAPSGTGGCTSGSNCLTVNYRGDTYRGLLAFGGRRLSTTAPAQTRPPTSVTDLFEGTNSAVGNATPLAPFAGRDPTLMVNRTFNDRIAVIDSN